MAMLAVQNSYSSFKTLFNTLEGRKTTPLFAADEVATSGFFIAIASFPDRSIFIQVRQATKPSTFDADFPQAVYVDDVSVNS